MDLNDISGTDDLPTVLKKLGRPWLSDTVEKLSTASFSWDGFIERFFPKVASVLAFSLVFGFAWLMTLQWALNGGVPIRVNVVLAIAVALPAPFYRDLWRGRTWALSLTAGVGGIATLAGVILFLRGPEIIVIIGSAFWATLTYFSGRIVRDRFRRARRT